MSQVFGDFVENLPSSQEYLLISFSPSSTSLTQRWRNNGLSADFLADYLSSFFPVSDTDPASLERQAEVKSAVSYIANELLENAMKYSYQSSSSISMGLYLSEGNIVFQLTNSIQASSVKKFQQHIQELLTSDPSELYIRQIEKNALNGNSTEAGLGFLTMLNDYGAKLGWKFETFSTQEASVTTMVHLTI